MRRPLCVVSSDQGHRYRSAYSKATREARRQDYSGEILRAFKLVLQLPRRPHPGDFVAAETSQSILLDLRTWNILSRPGMDGAAPIGRESPALPPRSGRLRHRGPRPPPEPARAGPPALRCSHRCRDRSQWPCATPSRTSTSPGRSRSRLTWIGPGAKRRSISLDDRAVKTMGSCPICGVPKWKTATIQTSRPSQVSPEA